MSETAQTRELAGSIGPGLVIAGKYLLEQEIGRGSMGTVYRAVHVTLGTRFAIKLISTEHSQSIEARKRFSVEAKAAAKLRSRHVVQIYDDGETPEGNPYIVLEYLEGETLEQRIEREHDIPLAEAVRINSHVGRALARAHAQGIVHRDLKPANIFLVKSDDDEVGWIAKVLDFGIAKLDSHGEKGTTQAGTVLGTPLFMSPEQVRGASSVDHRADLYSMGMCLYHMLTGEFAFYRPNYSEILIGICTEPLPLLRAKAPWVPEAVERWFQRACAREPLERFQSADEMVEALSAAAGSPPLAKHKSVPDGRLAPETLVGYATPALVTQPGIQAPRIGQTLALEAASKTTPGHASPMSTDGRAGAPIAPIAIAIGGSRGSATGRDQREEQPQARSNSQLLWLGVGFGLLAIASIALTLLWLGKDELPRPAPRPETAAPSPAPSNAGPAPTAPPAPEQQPDPAVSSVAAASATVTASPKAKPKRVAPAKSPLGAGAPTGGRPAAPSGSRPGGSDLGF